MLRGHLFMKSLKYLIIFGASLVVLITIGTFVYSELHAPSLERDLISTGVHADIGVIGYDGEGDMTASDGARIHYWFYNRGSKLVTVFFHGGPGHGSEDFRVWQAEAHADEIGSILVFDQRGSGESEMRKEFENTITFDRYIQDIDELRNYVIPNNEVVIFGRSFGGLLAMNYANSQPIGVKGYMIVAPEPMNMYGDEDLDEAFTKKYTEKYLWDQFVADSNLIYKRVNDSGYVEPVVKELTHEEIRIEEETQLDFNKAIEQNMPELKDDNYHLVAALADVPTLVVFGSYDFMVPPFVIEKMKPYLPHATFLELEGSHFVAYALQDEFFAGVKTFFESLK